MRGQRERQIHAALREQLVRGLRLRFPYGDRQPRMRTAQLLDGGHHQGGDGGGERADPHLSGLALEVVEQFRIRPLQLGEHRLGMPQHQLRGVRQPYPPAVCLQERDAELFGQTRQLLRDRRGRHVQRLGGRGDRAQLLEGAQDPQLLDVPVGHAGSVRSQRRPPAPSATPA